MRSTYVSARVFQSTLSFVHSSKIADDNTTTARQYARNDCAVHAVIVVTYGILNYMKRLQTTYIHTSMLVRFSSLDHRAIFRENCFFTY